jgi:1A family penicillin-binding protein
MTASWRQHAARKRRERRHTYSSDSQSLNKQKLMARFSKFILIGVVLMVVFVVIGVPVLALTLPSPEKVIRNDGFSTKILDRNGKVLYDIFEDQRRSPVEINQVPEYLKQATVAIEDKHFYSHRGFAPLGILRGFSRFFTQGRAQGGSTLTQQLVKNVLLSSERSLIRKAKELVLTLQIESRYSKDQILALYLNEAPYGGTAWGVGAASEMYFGKNISELDLVQSAFLAGLPQRPSAYSPYSSTPKAYVGRTEAVLRRMREDDYITKEQEEEAKSQLENLQFIGKGADFKAPHFVQYVQKILEDRYGERIVEQGGLKVTTTLDLDLQEKAQQIVAEEIAKVESVHITNGASVVLDPESGEILSMVGSKDFNAIDYDGQVNVTMSLRQPGSAIKPIVYAAGLEKGYTASTLFMDVPTAFPGGEGQPEYKPENYDGKFRGPVQLRYGLANSINIPAVKMIALVGVRNALDKGYQMGLTSLEPTKETLSRVGLSLALGGGEVRLLELTGAYGSFMNGGLKMDPVAILKVEDKNGKVLEEFEKEDGERVLSEGTAFVIANILSDNNARSEVFGVNSLLSVPGQQIAVKTGTTNDKRDNWTVGGNPSIVVGVWVGNNDNSAMKQVASGVSGASPIWRKILVAGLEGRPKVTFDQPDDVVKMKVDTISGVAEHDGFPSREEYFVKGTEPNVEDSVHVKLKLCRGQDRLASPSDVAANNYDEKEFIVPKEEDPTSGSVNKWQEGILGWMSQSTDPRYKAPTEYCNSNLAPLNVEFQTPKDRNSDLDNEFNVKFSVDSANPIDLVRLEIDGVVVRSYTGGPYEYGADLDDGVHELRAIAKDNKGNESDRRITIGVNAAWDSE